MFISKKRLNSIEQRLEILEAESTANTYNFGKVNLIKLAKILDEMKCRLSKQAAKD